jgi:hypothetical protein
LVGLIIAFCVWALFIVAWIQIITKAGYSPWWILLPVSLVVLWIIDIFLLFRSLSAVTGYSAVNFQTFADAEQTLYAVILLDVILNMIMFFVFAFSEWPVMKMSRLRYPGDGLGPRSSRPFDRPSGGVGPLATTPQPLPSLEGQPPGWYRSGSVGAGEQSYWDGSAWTACRRWQNNAWVDLPVPAEPDAAVGAGPEPLS